MTTIVDTTPFDPMQAITSALRVLAPPTRFAPAVLDTPFPNGEVARAICVATSGAVEVVKLDGTAEILPFVEAGKWFAVVCTQVNSAGTAATGVMWGS